MLRPVATALASDSCHLRFSLIAVSPLVTGLIKPPDKRTDQNTEYEPPPPTSLLESSTEISKLGIPVPNRSLLVCGLGKPYVCLAFEKLHPAQEEHLCWDLFFSALTPLSHFLILSFPPSIHFCFRAWGLLFRLNFISADFQRLFCKIVLVSSDISL
jgi:hypothetical protein